MRKLIIIIPALFLIFSINGIASHVAGVELTATHITGDNYLVTLSFYRDCSGVTVDATSTIYFNSSCGSFTVTLNQVSGTGTEIPIYCNSAYPTTCNGGLLFGVQKTIYQGIVTISPCSDWIFYYTMCCRNPSNTIINSTSDDIYVEATLDNLNAPFNSLPEFFSDPAFVICNAQTSLINNSAYDSDGDSLSYKFVTPFDDGPLGAVPYVVFDSGYSANQPLPSLAPIEVDSLSGYFIVWPNLNMKCIYALRVDEYRKINGIPLKIGSVMRDIQVNIISCDVNMLPGIQIAGINPNATQFSILDNNYYYEVPADSFISFNIYPYCMGASRDINLQWDNGIPDASFIITNNNTTTAVGHFSWNSYWSDTSSNNHYFEVSASDSFCTKTAHYCLRVISYQGVKKESKIIDVLSIFPNPANDRISISLANNISGCKIEILDILGQKVMNKEYNLNNKNFFNISLANISNGVYFIQLTTDKKSYRKKLVISR